MSPSTALRNSPGSELCVSSQRGDNEIRLKRRLLIAVGLLLLIGGGFAAYLISSAWGEVQRVEIDRSLRPTASGSDEEPDSVSSDEPDQQTPIELDEGRQVFLLVGSDSREALEDIEGFGEFGGSRADVVMVLFKDGPDTALLSLPRDLLVTDACRGSEAKLSGMLEGCDDMNGPTSLLLTVEDTINHPIDHFALVDLAGFQEAVDALGGYEICVENPVRDEKADLELPAGCTDANGEQTLAWMRSRMTQELTDSGWRIIPGMNDLARNERQRSFMIDMMRRMGDITSPQDMAAAGQVVAPFITIDSELSFISAVNLALTLRGLGLDDVVELSVPVVDYTTAAGASALLPSTPVSDIVAEYLASLTTTAEASAR